MSANFTKEDMLMEAAKLGRYDYVSRLLDDGADIHAGGNEALGEAISAGHLDVVKMMIRRGADLFNLKENWIVWVGSKEMNDYLLGISNV